jgi:hypothetical protein
VTSDTGVILRKSCVKASFHVRLVHGQLRAFGPLALGAVFMMAVSVLSCRRVQLLISSIVIGPVHGWFARLTNEIFGSSATQCSQLEGQRDGFERENSRFG